MKIDKLKAENVKKLKCVELNPGTDVVVLTGKNGQGKSSVLDAIWYALGGKRVHPEQVIRDGEDEAEVELEIENYRVRRTWSETEEGEVNSYLYVYSDGDKLSGPQSVLDDIVGRLSFDPWKFAQMDDDEQRETLLEVSGKKSEVEEIEEERESIYQERRDINRDIKSLKGVIDDAPDFDDDIPDEERSVSEISEEMEEVQKDVQTLRNCKQTSEDNLSEIEKKKVKIQELQEEIDELVEEKEKAEDRVDEIEDKYEEAPSDRLKQLKRQLNTAEEVNEKVREKKKIEEKKEQLEDLEEESNQKTQKLEELDDQKDQILSDTDLPVDGLSVNGHQVLYQETPFSQCSTGEKIKISSALGMALNPDLKVMFVREASLLDEDNRQLLIDIAQENEFQVWLEQVGDQQHGIKFVEGEIDQNFSDNGHAEQQDEEVSSGDDKSQEPVEQNAGESIEEELGDAPF